MTTRPMDPILLELAAASLGKVRDRFHARYLRNVEPGGIGCYLTDDHGGQLLCPKCGQNTGLPLADSRSVAWLIADSEEWETRCSCCDALLVEGISEN